MDHQLIICFLMFCVISSAFCQKLDVSGIRIRITRRGLDYASALATEILDEELSKAPIPRIEAVIDQGPGHGHVSVMDINMTSFKAPDFSFELHPEDDSLTFGSKGGMVSLTGNWKAWYKVLFNVSLSGTIKAAATEINIKLRTIVGKTPKGVPMVNITKCEAEIGSLSLEVDGGVIQWIVNLFRHLIASDLKRSLAAKFCEASGGMLMNLANHELQTLPTKIPLYEQFYLNYGLSKAPTVKTNYIQSSMRAEITWQGETATPIHPVPLPNVTTAANASRMLYFWGSDYVLNTFLYTAHTHQAIQFILNKDTDTKLAIFLKTTCTLICIGRVIPQIGEKYPNKTIDIHIHSSSPPNAEIQPTGAILNATAFADIYVNPWNETRDLIFRAEIVFYGTLALDMMGRKVVGNLSIEIFHIKLVKSNIGEISPKALKVLEDVAKPALQEIANAHLMRGFAIPVVEGVLLVRPEVKLLNRAVEIETDLSYRKYFPRKILKNWIPVFKQI